MFDLETICYVKLMPPSLVDTAKRQTSMTRNKKQSTIRDDILIERLESLDFVSSLVGLREEMLKIARVFGLKNLSYGVINLPPEINNDRALVVTTYTFEWHKCYFDNSYIDIDPIVKVASSGVSPVDWRSISRKAPAVRAFFEDAQKFEVGSQGLTLPIRGRLGEIALFSVTSDERDDSWDLFVKTNVSYLLIFAWNFHNCVLRILGASSQSPIALSHREATCLRMKALGRTDNEIAGILGITKRTVSFHLESARSRLNAVNAVHAVAKALSLGLITLAHEPMVKTL